VPSPSDSEACAFNITTDVTEVPDDLFTIDNQYFGTPTSTLNSVIPPKSDEKDIILWHRRLGHLRILGAKTAASVATYRYESLCRFSCQLCLKHVYWENSIDNLLSVLVSARQVYLITLISWDPCAQICSISSKRYAIRFTDEFTRLRWCDERDESLSRKAKH